MIFGGIECVDPVAYVAHFVFLGICLDSKFRTQRAAVASRLATNLELSLPSPYLVTHLPSPFLVTYLPS